MEQNTKPQEPNIKIDKEAALKRAEALLAQHASEANTKQTHGLSKNAAITLTLVVVVLLVLSSYVFILTI